MAKRYNNYDSLFNDLGKLQKKFVDRGIDIISQEHLKDANRYAPMDTGNLIRSSQMHSDFGKGILKWVTPYARRLYYNPQFSFSKDSNPYARGYWSEEAKRDNVKKYQRMLIKLFGQTKKDVF